MLHQTKIIYRPSISNSYHFLVSGFLDPLGNNPHRVALLKVRGQMGHFGNHNLPKVGVLDLLGQQEL